LSKKYDQNCPFLHLITVHQYKKAMTKPQKTIDSANKRAAFEYFFLEQYTAGLALMGTEIKSIRQGKFNMSDSYCLFDDNELNVRNLHISPYEKSTYFNHEPLRDRKLLLKKRELKRLALKLNDQGLTIVPVRLFINERGLAKLEIALAKGKKLYDKRETIKDRDLKRQHDDD
jgi:SsrA-binding protein